MILSSLWVRAGLKTKIETTELPSSRLAINACMDEVTHATVPLIKPPKSYEVGVLQSTQRHRKN